MNNISDSLREKISSFVQEGIDISKPKIHAESDPFWRALNKTGTELWLDTGDIEGARSGWSAEMTALTTNNTLLNKEIQKGIYDDLIKEAHKLLGDVDLRQRIVEIAFILNAGHGLRLVEEFGGKVSVELHTDLSHDLEGIVAYGCRFFEICPSNFIIKVPFTATGLLGARRLEESGVPVNFTLEFSARQNALAAIVAKPHYVNVFLGRLNAFVADNNLGSGENVGEKTTIASQRIVSKIREEHGSPTKQIAASLRNGLQIASLAGVDVFTMPLKAADEAKEILDGNFTSRVNEEYGVRLADGVDSDEVRISKLWSVSDRELELAQSLDEETPKSGEALIDRARTMGSIDIFPNMSEEEMEIIAQDGKIPVHSKWKQRINDENIAVDSLMNLAGLASFTADQAALDGRIRDLIS
jgi:transaldolase